MIKLNNEIKITVPDYLKDFFSGIYRLCKLKQCAAWEGLSVESQIIILKQDYRVSQEVCIKALDSPNEYIRYLASFRLSLDEDTSEGKIILEKINSDSSPLVRVSQKRIYTLVNNCEEFFNLSQEQRLVIINSCCFRQGDDVAKIINWGIENKAIKQQDLDDLLLVYADNIRAFKEYTHDYDLGGINAFEALWNLVPKLGKTDAATFLLWSLPDKVFANFVPEKILDSLDGEQLCELLNRRPLWQFRKLREKIISDQFGRYDEKLKNIASKSEDEHEDDWLVDMEAVDEETMEGKVSFLYKEVKRLSETVQDFQNSWGDFQKWGGVVIIGWLVIKVFTFFVS